MASKMESKREPISSTMTTPKAPAPEAPKAPAPAPAPEAPKVPEAPKAPEAGRRMEPPPPPTLAKRPHRPRQPTPAPAPPSAEPARPVLSADPAEREKQLETVRGEASTVLAILAMVVSRLTPSMPMTDEESAAVQGPLEQVLYKYGGAIPCEWQLAAALGFVALPRYGEWKKLRAEKPIKDL